MEDTGRDVSGAETDDEETLAGGDETRGAPRPSPARTPLEEGSRVGRYLLLDALGRGAMGRVFTAYDPELDRRVAIKLLLTSGDDEAERARLLDEAKVMARIDHPNVIAVYDAGVHEGVVYVAMALVRGPSLRAWMATQRSEREILDVFIGAGHGLQAAHDAGVVHRDFKPANVLVTEGGIARVGDFGLARREADGPGRAVEERHAVGTPAYMSPEHLSGEGVDARSDQFSFCVALSEALHGERPFVAEGLPSLARKIVDGEMTSRVARAPGRIGRLLRRGLAADPERRFASMHELLRELERIRRPTLSRWLLGTAVVGVAAIAWMGAPSDSAQCDRGEERAAEVWNDDVAASLKVARGPFNSGFAKVARERLEAALDEYAAAWAEAYDESCAQTASRPGEATPAQRETAQCLESRLDSLAGIVDFMGSPHLDVGHLGDLALSLPSLEDCRTGEWVPYPADPRLADEARRLDHRLHRLRMNRMTEAKVIPIDEARDVVEAARALGHPHFLVRALRELGRAAAEKKLPEAPGLLAEATELALSSGYDLLAQGAINDQLILYSRLRPPPESSLQLAAVGRGLADRHERWERAGDIEMNRGNILHHSDRYDEALAAHDLAGELFARAGDEVGVLRARLNNVAVLFSKGDTEQALALTPDLLRGIEEALGSHSYELIRATNVLAYGLVSKGHLRKAMEVSGKALDHAREMYAVGSYTLHQIALTHAITSIAVGDAVQARAALGLARSPAVEGRAIQPSLEAIIDMVEGDLETAAQRLDEARARFADEPATTWIVNLDLIRVQVHLLAGEREAAHRLLASSRLWYGISIGDVAPAVRAVAAFLGAASEAPDPPSTTWRELLGDEPAMRAERLLREAALAMLQDPRDVERVQALRDELVSIHNPASPDVGVMDRWLSRQRDADAPP